VCAEDLRQKNFRRLFNQLTHPSELSQSHCGTLDGIDIVWCLFVCLSQQIGGFLSTATVEQGQENERD